MNSHVAIFNNKQKALDAIDLLNKKHFPIDKVSLVEKADIVVDHIKIKSFENIKMIPLLAFIFVGMVLGILASLNVFTFPGFYFLERVSPVIGGFIGLDIGLVSGTLLIIIITIIKKKDSIFQSNKHIEGIQYLVIVNGTIDDIEKAEHILRTEGIHKQRIMCNYCNVKRVSKVSETV